MKFSVLRPTGRMDSIEDMMPGRRRLDRARDMALCRKWSSRTGLPDHGNQEYGISERLLAVRSTLRVGLVGTEGRCAPLTSSSTEIEANSSHVGREKVGLYGVVGSSGGSGDI